MDPLAAPAILARTGSLLTSVGFALAGGQDRAECFAHDADAIGDVTGDGFPDMAIGNVDYQTYGRTKVLIYSPRDRKVLMDVPGLAEAGYVLRAEGAGDLDGDGIGEFAIILRTHTTWDDGVLRPTHLRMVRGGTLETIQDREGDGFVLGGDYDGDGRADIGVVVRDPLDGFREVRFECSGTDALSPLSLLRMQGPFVLVGDCNDSPGTEVAMIEDSSDSRRLLIYSPKRGEEVASIGLESIPRCDRVSTSSIGDHNADGVLDLAVAYCDDYVEGASQATVRVFSGRDCTRLLEVTEHSIEKIVDKGWGRGFGSSVLSIGDLDADGHRDLAIGMDCYSLSIGGVAIFSGSTGKYMRLVGGGLEDGHFGESIGTGADWNGDGTEDWWVCSQPFGGQRGRGGLAVYSGRDGSLLERVESVADLERKPAKPK